MGSISASAATLQRERPRLVLLAYRMCGSWADAEDIVQTVTVEWLRSSDTVANPEGWLTTVTVRRALDVLRGRRRDAAYVGPWLPEPLIASPEDDPFVEAERGFALTTAFLVLAEELTPPQRAVVVLRALCFEHPEIAEILQVTSAASRQHYTRALRRLAELNGRDPLDDETLGLSRARGRGGSSILAKDLLAAFLRAAQEGDTETLAALLHDQVAAYQDGGGRTRAARRVLVGRANVARFVAGVTALHDGGRSGRLVTVGGEPGALVTLAGVIHVVSVQVRDGRLYRLFDVCNPEKHGRVRDQPTARAA